MRKSYLLAILIALGAAAWVASGRFDGRLFGISAEDATAATAAAEAEADAAEQPMAVRVLRSSATKRMRDIVVQGRTAAKRSVQLRAEVEGGVLGVARKGARVKEGDVLVRLSVDDREARLEEAQALVRQRQLEHQAAKQLSAKGFRAETQLAAAAAQLDAAKAMVKRMELELAKTVIRAPFAGIVNERAVEIGGYVKNGDPLAVLVDEEPYLVVAQLSETDVGQLRTGSPGSARLVTGQTVEGRISFISETAAPETRTFRVELEVPNADHSLRAGVTAELRFPTGTVMAHRLSPAALTLNDDGVLGVRLVDADGVVQFHPSRIVADTPDGVWLAGLPETADIIVVGQEFVHEGQRVEAQPVEAGGERPTS